jgi:hypothetical protein
VTRQGRTFLAVGLGLVLQVGCTHRVQTSPAAAAQQAAIPPPYVDLQSGWRVRVVTPLLKSGGYIVPSLAVSGADTTHLVAGDDLIGYEKDYYTVAARQDSGIALRLADAEVWEKGTPHPVHEPKLRVFQTSDDARYVRLVYLVRVSQADHDMAIIAANDPTALDQITHDVVDLARCEASSLGICTWVPAGVAVAPEKLAKVKGKSDWVPVN